MRKLTKFAMGVFGISALSLEAALPPVYQSIHEYEALLESPELTTVLGDVAPIIDIQRHEGGFTVVTSNKSIEVALIYDPSDHPGPAKFHFNFNTQEPSRFKYPDFE